MPFVLVRVQVEDYPKWKLVMEEHVSKRKKLGSKGTRIFRDSERANHILCLTEWEDFSRAREFMGWGDLDEIGRRSTRTGAPEVEFLDEVDVLPA